MSREQNRKPFEQFFAIFHRARKRTADAKQEQKPASLRLAGNAN